MSNLNSEPNRSQDNSETFLHSSIENSQKLDGGRDLHPAIQQLFALGYGKGDRVTGRNISITGRNNDWAATLTEDSIELQEYSWKTGSIELDGEYHKDGLAWLNKENQLGKQIYFNVNGGRTNKEVSRIFAVFFEHDSGTHAEQMSQVVNFPIPASVAVRTRKSTHTYYTVYGDDIFDIEGWVKLQEKIAYTMGSDPAVKDRPRLMRLAGFDHIKDGHENVLCTLEICDGDNSYTFAEIEQAIAAYATKKGVKPFTEERFLAYQFVNNRLNQKKDGRDYRHPRFNPDLFRTCEESEIAELIQRSKDWARLCDKKRKGEDVDPESAWTDELKTVHARVKKEYNIDLIPSLSQGGELLTVKWAKAYTEGFEENGRAGWHTCKCPAHGGHSDDSLHINVVTGALKCHGGCDSRDVEVCLRQMAKDAEDETWKWTTARFASSHKQTEELTPEEDALQLELERILYHESSRIDYKKCEELGIKVTFIEKSHTEFAPEDLNIEKGKISIISSGMGTGKSVNTGKALADYPCLYSWYSRRVLAQSAAKTLDLTYIDDLNKETKNRNRLSFCSQRSYQQSPAPMGAGGALVIDECDDVFDYNFEDLCNRDGIRPMILKTLEVQLNAALHNGTAVFMSADVSQKEIDYIFAIAPKGTPIELVTNTYQMPRGKCYFSTDASPEGLVEKIVELVKTGEAVYLLDDFKNGYKGCKTLSEYIRQQMPGLPDSAFRTIHGENSGSHENRDYLDDINESSLNTTLMCVSPSVVQGVSLENGHFKHVFAIINGILTDKKVTQGISRVRGVENTYIWVAERGVNINSSGGITPRDINNYYQRNYESRNKYILQFNPDYSVIKDEWNSPHWELRCKNLAYSNLVMRRLRYWVKARLEGEGYELIPTEFGTNKNLDLLLKDLWKGIGVIEALKIGDANVLDKVNEEKIVAKIKRGESLLPEEKADLAKTHIHKLFGEELTAKTRAEAHLNARTVTLTGYAAVAYKNRNNRSFERNLMRNYRLFHGGVEEAAKRDINREKAQERLGEKFVGDIKWSTREFKMWELFDVKQFFVPGKRFTPLDFYQTYTKMLEVADHIKDAGWIDISEKNCGTVFGELLHDFGYETEKKKITLSNGKRIFERWITQESFNYVTEFVNYQLAEKLKTDPGIGTQKTNCPPPPKYIVNGFFTGGGGQLTQNLTQQDLQPVFEARFFPKADDHQNGGWTVVKTGVDSMAIDENKYQQFSEKMMAIMSKESKPVLDKDGLPPLHKPTRSSSAAVRGESRKEKTSTEDSSKKTVVTHPDLYSEEVFKGEGWLPSVSHTPHELQPSFEGLNSSPQEDPTDRMIARIGISEAQFSRYYGPPIPF